MRKVYKDVFEETTVRALCKLISKGTIEGLESPIKVGKESDVFSALTEHKERVAVKIYRITACDFLHMSRYLKQDLRFRMKKSRRAIVLQWAKREFMNLKKAYEAKVSVPKPLECCGNALVMQFVGTQLPAIPIPAPLVKDKTPGNFESFFSLLLKDIKKLYHEARLIHSDLSEFNILNWNEKPVMIDLSHGLSINAPAAREMLERDIKNVYRFFSKYMKVDEKEIYDKITKK